MLCFQSQNKSKRSHRFGLLVSFAVTALFVGVASAADYQRPELLISPTELGELRAQAAEEKVELVLLGVTADLAGFNVPVINTADWKQAFGDGTDNSGWSKRLSKLGIAKDRPVVILGDGITPTAARMWWILQYWGVEQARLLNGDWKSVAWRSGDYQPPAATNYYAKANPERLRTRDQMLALASGSGKTCLLDTRSTGEFSSGAVPGATRLEWSDVVDAETGQLLPADELQQRFKRAGFHAGQPVVTYCRSGGRASVVAFAAEVLNGQPAANYYGSWNDWQAGDSPVVLPAEAQEAQ